MQHKQVRIAGHNVSRLSLYSERKERKRRRERGKRKKEGKGDSLNRAIRFAQFQSVPLFPS
jgi:hypothetical protein